MLMLTCEKGKIVIWRSTSSAGGSVVVDPDHGAAVMSIRAPRGSELMATGLPPREPDPADFLSTGLSGWHDCFPTIAAGETTVVRGALVPLGDHGDLWHRRWAVEEESPEALRMTCRVPALGVVATRAVSWDGPRLVVASGYRTEADAVIPFVWASHPLFHVDDATWIDLPDSPATRWPRGDAVERLSDTWPATDDRRLWRDVPGGTAVKLFLPWPGRGIRFSTGGQVWHLDARFEGIDPEAARLGLWINRAGFPQHSPLSHLAIEPTVGSADSLPAAQAEGTAQVLSAGGGFDVAVVLEPLME